MSRCASVSAGEMQSLPTDEEVANFRNQGFWVSDPLVSSAELDRLREHAMKVRLNCGRNALYAWCSSHLPVAFCLEPCTLHCR